MSTTQQLTAPDGTPLNVHGELSDLTDEELTELGENGVLERTEDGTLDLRWAFWEPQREAFHATVSGDYDIVGFVGGYRSGKSVTGARALWEIALNPAFGQTRNICMGVSYAEAKKTTYPVLFEELPGASHEEVDPFLYNGDPENSPVVSNFNKQDGIITLETGDVVILASADKPDRYKGGKFSSAWLDEFAHYKSDRQHGIRKTVTERFDFGEPATMLVTTTGNGFNPAYDILHRQVDDDDNPLGSNVYTVTASSLNNPFLTTDDRNRLLRTHGSTSQSEQALHGSFTAAKGLVYDAFRRQSHTVTLRETEHNRYTSVDDDGNPTDRLTVSSDWRMYGYDAGWDDPRVLLEIGKTDYGQLIVLNEFYKSEKHVSDCIRWLADYEKPHGVIYCEHEPGDISKFRNPSQTSLTDPPSGYRAGKAKKDVDAGIDEVRYRLREDHDGRPGLLVASRCENLISEFLSYTEDDVGGSDVDDHALDALRYAVYTHSLRGSSSGSSSGSGTYVSKR